MRAGKQRHKVTIQTNTSTGGTMGDVTEKWADTQKVWAAIHPMRGSEQFIQGQLVSEIPSKIRIRYLDYTTLTPKNRIKYGSRIFNIRSVINVEERNIFFEALVTENV